MKPANQIPVFVDLHGEQYHVRKKLRSTIFRLPMAIRHDAMGYVHLCPNGPREISLARAIIYNDEVKKFDQNEGVTYTSDIAPRIRVLCGGNYYLSSKIQAEIKCWIDQVATSNGWKWFERELMVYSFRNINLAYEFRPRWGV